MDSGSRREDKLARGLEELAWIWLIVLPLMRPLIWSGEYTTLDNLLYLSMLAAATATGLLHAALSGQRPRTSICTWLGAVFLLLAAVGCLRSDLPARSWAMWSAWMLHLAAPFALADFIRRRPSYVLAGLAGGLLLEGIFMLGQTLWERPALSAQFHDDLGMVESERMRDQYDIRIHSWRLEGTFLLANTLAAYLICLIPPLIGSAWKAWKDRVGSRGLVTALAVLAIALLASSGSKGGILALLVAMGATALFSVRSPRLRAFAIGSCVVVAALALCSSTIRERLSASAGVRIEYWRAGMRLVAEKPVTGHGMDGYQVHFPRVKDPAGEDTIIAHNEALQAAVDLGIPAAMILVIWCFSLLRRMRAAESMVEPERFSPGWPRVLAATAMAFYALFLVGVMRDRFSVWPSPAWWNNLQERFDLVPSIWALAITAAIPVLLLACRRMPMPPPAAWFAGALACLLHALVDFHLHSPQVVGILAFVIVAGTIRSERPETVLLTRRGARLFAPMAAIVLLAAVSLLVYRTGLRDEQHERMTQVDGALRRIHLTKDLKPEDEQRALAEDLLSVVLIDRGIPPAGDEAILMLAKQSVEELRRESFAFPQDPRLMSLAVSIAAHTQSTLPDSAPLFTESLVEFARRCPVQVVFVKALADHYQLLAELADRAGETSRASEYSRQAQEWSQRAIVLFPSNLPFHEQLVQLAVRNGDQELAEHERQFLHEMAGRVYPTSAARRKW